MGPTTVLQKALSISLLVLFCIIQAGIVSAGTNVWTSIGPEGGNINALSIDPETPATLYVATGSGVFKSINGGGNWTAVNSDLTNTSVQALAINPQTPATLYAGTGGGGVFKSINGGENWTAVNTDLTNTYVRALAVNPQTPAILYAATGDGVFKSINGGGNWTAVYTGVSSPPLAFFGAKGLVIDPTTPDTLYAIITYVSSPVVRFFDSVIKSKNGGGDWSTIYGSTPNKDVTALAIDPATPATLYVGIYGGGVFISTNNGGNWTAVNTDLTNTYVRALAINPQRPATLYAGTYSGGVFKSTNGGGNWPAFNTGLTNTRVTSLAINHATPNTLYAGTDGGGVFAIQQVVQLYLPLILRH